jgi:hypothetical protein
VRGDVAQPGSVECGQHPSRGGLSPSEHRDIVIQVRNQWNLSAVSDQAGSAGQRDMRAARRGG